MTVTTQDTDVFAPFEIWEVALDNAAIKFYQPLLLTSTWMPDDPREPELDIRTMMSHGMTGGTFSANLTSDMAHQCRLTKDQFLDFIDCRMSEEEYRELINEEYGVQRKNEY
jgi:hypothetical protein